MTSTVRAWLSGLAFAAAIIGATSPAFAWGCIAVSEEGTYGYSYNFDSQGPAMTRALNECANRTTEDSVCEITECDEDD